MSVASVNRTKERSKVGKHRMGGVTKASHSWLNADCLTKDQHQTVPLRSKSDKGAASHAKWWIYLL